MKSDLLRGLIRDGLPLTGKWLVYGLIPLLAMVACLWFKWMLWGDVPYAGLPVDQIRRDNLFTRFVPAVASCGALAWWCSALAVGRKTRHFSKGGCWGLAWLFGSWVLLTPLAMMGMLLFLPLALIIALIAAVRVAMTKRHAWDLLTLPAAVVLAELSISYARRWFELYGD